MEDKKYYISFHGFGKAKFAFGGSILGSSQFPATKCYLMEKTIQKNLATDFYNGSEMSGFEENFEYIRNKIQSEILGSMKVSKKFN